MLQVQRTKALGHLIKKKAPMDRTVRKRSPGRKNKGGPLKAW